MAAARPKAETPPLPAPTVALPPEITERLLGQVDRISGTLARRLASEIPLPAGFRSRAYLRSVLQASRDGVEALVQQLHDVIAYPARLSGLYLSAYEKSAALDERLRPTFLAEAVA